MIWGADHSEFVIASYGISVIVLGALIYHILRRDKQLQVAIKAKNEPK